MSEFETAASGNLMEKARSDPAAFVALYRQFRDPVYTTPMPGWETPKMLKTWLARFFWNVLEDLDGYRDEGHFAGLDLHQLPAPGFADFYRRRKAAGGHRADLWPVRPAPGSCLSSSSMRKNLKSLGTLLHLLAEDEKELLRLRFSARLSFKDIASVLNRKESAIKMSITA